MEKGNKIYKPFNKKKFFREKFKKNFGSQQEGHGRALLQKKAFVRQYYKEKRFERKKGNNTLMNEDVFNRTDEPELERFALFAQEKSEVPQESRETHEEESSHPEQKRKQKQSSWKRAKQSYHQKIAENAAKHEAAKQREQAIQSAAIRRKEERLKRNKKLSQFTSKGQPVMRGRIELMLEKLEQELS